jgi:hypothetical protein
MKWNGRNYNTGQGPKKPQKFENIYLNKRRDEKFSNIWGAAFIGDVQPPEDGPQPTPSITASPTVTPSATITSTPTNTSSSTPEPTTTPTPTPSNAQFCKRYTGVQTSVGNGSIYVYTACNNYGGSLLVPNSVFGATVTVYSRSGAPTKLSGTGVMTWTDQGFGEPCSGSSFYGYVCNTNLGSSATVTDCGGATYNQQMSASGQGFAGCFTAISCNTNCGQVSITNLGSCTT